MDLAEAELIPGDLFLFCSDGLTGMVTDREMQTILELPGMELLGMVDQLIDRACEMGGVDNVSVILARVIDNEKD